VTIAKQQQMERGSVIWPGARADAPLDGAVVTPRTIC
jgi:hypothetical protein